MFPNLEAEQARNGHTNADVATRLGLSRQAYESKKRTGNFKIVEAINLAAIYGVTCNYLFSTEKKMSMGLRLQNTKNALGG